MVVQSASAAAELFKKHDVPFADRKVPDALTAFDFHAGSLGMNTYGGHWRVLRRLCSVEFLVNKRMNETTELRRRILDNMVILCDKFYILFSFTHDFNMVCKNKVLMTPKESDSNK